MLGTSVGNYKVTQVIGSGGMGAVYLAQHSILRRPAAVKVLLPEMSQKREVVNRFFNEARAATAVRHPGIVEVYDFGYLTDGSAYIIMEYLEGETLGRRLFRNGKMSAARALLATRQIAGALSAAHGQQIVHRDLKPDNLFIVRDADLTGGERIKLLDFGIAKLTSEDVEQQSHTRTGTVMGTPRYMSPEQCRGAGATVLDARADLYSLGCILYEMLCGRPPFIADGDGDIIAHHLYFPPERPQHHEPSIPDDVSALVMRLLEKAPDHRPDSATALLGEIEKLAPLPLTPQEIGPVTIPPAPIVTTPPVVATRSTTLSGTASQVERPISPQTVSIKGPLARSAETPDRRKLLWRGSVGIAGTAAAVALTLKLLGGGPTPAPAQSDQANGTRTSITGSAASPVQSAEPGSESMETPAPLPISGTEGSAIATRTSQIAPPMAPPLAAEKVSLQFVVQPDDAAYQIRVDGKLLEGTEIEVPKSRTERLEIKVTARGYRTYASRVLPISDLALPIELTPERKPGRASAPAKPPTLPGKRVDRIEGL